LTAALLFSTEKAMNNIFGPSRRFRHFTIRDIKTRTAGGYEIYNTGPNGVLENVMLLVGYEGLCYLMADDPELVEEIFNQVGTRLVRYYELALQYDSVGACISNDDWGFNTQTMLSVRI
jgi:hypothetical protein